MFLGLSLPILSACVVGGYLLGSVPFGVIVTRLGGMGDVRKIGSGNIGATNVLRTGRKDLALATLLLDGGKGAAAALLARWAFHSETAGVLAGGAAFVGHLFPVWLGFKGGKGVATFLGVMLAVAWPVGLLACATWLAVFYLMRFSSLAALAAAALSPGFALLLRQPREVMWLALLMAVLVFVRHHANIRRLRAGTEPRVGSRKTAPDPA